MADALSHGLMPGTAISFVLWPQTPWLAQLTGAAGAIALATITSWLQRASRLPRDAVFSGLSLGCMGLTALCVSRDIHHMAHALVGWHAIPMQYTWVTMSVITATSWLFFAIYGRTLLWQSFDSLFMGIVYPKRRWPEAIFWGMVVVNLLAALPLVGSLLALAMIVLPALIARLLTHRMLPMLACAVLAVVLAGMMTAWAQLSTSSGPVMITVLAIFYLVALIREQKQRSTHVSA